MTPRKTLMLILFLGLVTLGVLFVDSLAKAPTNDVPTTPADELVLVIGTPADELVDSRAARARAADVEPPSGEDGVDWHIVRPGETLRAIALQYLGDAEYDVELARINDLDDPDRIEVGQRLRLR